MLRDDLDRRVRVHAALADPHRLRIVDALAASDLSPAELGVRLGLPSNLLAHHLRTLEAAGVLTRHRSSGDRRRTYLTLDVATLTDLVPSHLPTTEHASGGVAPVTRVVFVCTANTARSQLAAALWNQTDTARDVPAASAGTHPADRIAPGTLKVARRRRLPIEQVSPRSLSQLDDPLTDSDYLVTVCDNAHEELAPDRTRPADAHWSVPDPVPSNTAAAFEAAYDDLASRVAHLAPRLKPAS
jgi:protein-tyrosine-phosphatase/DNA-binding transcriptional ArsR family regulator